MAILVVVVAVLAGSSYTAANEAGEAQKVTKPIQRVSINIDGISEPRSAEELLRASGFIVEGIVEGAEDRDLHLHPDDPNLVVRTGYLVRVTEVFKNSRPGRFPTVISVLLPIGTRDRGTFIEEWVFSRLLPLEMHHQYVLFLRSSDNESDKTNGNGNGNDYELATVGDSSVIEISNTRATGRDPHSVAAGLARAGAAQLRSDLRAKGRGGPR